MKWPFGKIRKIRCPDGSEKYVFRDPDDAFPLYAKDWSARLEATVKALTKLQGGLVLNLKKNIEGFFFELDEANRSMQSKLRAIYVIFLTAPCKLDRWLIQQIQNVIEEEGKIRIRRIEIEIEKIRSLKSRGLNKKRITQAVTEALTRLSRSEIEVETSDAFKRVKKNTKAWRKRTQ